MEYDDLYTDNTTGYTTIKSGKMYQPKKTQFLNIHKSTGLTKGRKIAIGITVALLIITAIVVYFLVIRRTPKFKDIKAGSTITLTAPMGVTTSNSPIFVNYDNEILKLNGTNASYMGYQIAGVNKAYTGFVASSIPNRMFIDNQSRGLYSDIYISTEYEIRRTCSTIVDIASASYGITTPLIYINTNGCPINWFVNSEVGSVQGINFSSRDLYLGNNKVCDNTYLTSNSFTVRNTSSTNRLVIDSSGDTTFSGDVRLDSSIATGRKLYWSLSNSNKFSLSLDSNISFSLYDEGQGKQAMVSELYYDRIYFPHGNLGIGNSSPSAKLHVESMTEQLRLAYDTSNYTSFTVDSNGDMTVSSKTTFTNGINLGNQTLTTYIEGTFHLDLSTDANSLFHGVSTGTQLLCKYVIIGKLVHVYIPEMSANSAVTAPVVNRKIIGSMLPSEITPAFDSSEISTTGIDAGVPVNLVCVIDTTGLLTISRTLTSYAGTTGGSNFSFSNIQGTYLLS